MYSKDLLNPASLPSRSRSRYTRPTWASSPPGTVFRRTGSQQGRRDRPQRHL